MKLLNKLKLRILLIEIKLFFKPSIKRQAKQIVKDHRYEKRKDL